MAASFTLEEILARAYAYLSRRDRTTREMRQHLRKGAGAEEDVIEAAIAQLTERGYLDDSRYAQFFVEDRRKLDSWGSERIRRRLLELGIDRETVELACRQEDDERELIAALTLLRRRVKLIIPEDPRSKQRALALLMRRGYPQSVAYDAVRLFEQETAPAS